MSLLNYDFIISRIFHFVFLIVVDWVTETSGIKVLWHYSIRTVYVHYSIHALYIYTHTHEKQLFSIYYLCVYTYALMCCGMHVEVRRQQAVVSSLPMMCVSRIVLGFQAWAVSPTCLSFWSTEIIEGDYAPPVIINKVLLDSRVY